MSTVVGYEENPVFDFGDYGIVFHFDYWSTEGLAKSDADLESIERDILAYAYRDERPFHSESLMVGDDLNCAYVDYPRTIYYSAEGEERALSLNTLVHGQDGGRTRRFDVCAFRTVFEGRGDRKEKKWYDAVLHVAFVPHREGGETVAESVVNEYDVVKLLKLWEGGEGIDQIPVQVDPAKEPPDLRMGTQLTIRVGREGRRVMKIEELAAKILEAAGVPQRKGGQIRLRVGTIQLRIGEKAWRPIYERLADLRSNRPGADDRFCEAKVRKDWKKFKGLCGLISGLLSIELPDEAEMRDTFQLPMNLTSDAMLVLNKGTLLMVSDKCRLGEVLGPKLGVNPYLSIPHAVLLYNEVLLQRALSHARENDESGVRESRLQRAELEMRRALQYHYLPNIFHYSRERMLFEHGAETRRLRELERNAFQRLEGVNGTLDEVRDGKRRILQMFLDMFVVLLTIVQVIGNYDALSKLAHDRPWEFWLILGYMLAVGSVLFAFTNRRGWPLSPLPRFLLIAGIGALSWALLFICLKYVATDPTPGDSETTVTVPDDPGVPAPDGTQSVTEKAVGQGS